MKLRAPFLIAAGILSLSALLYRLERTQALTCGAVKDQRCSKMT
jgi:hypothetical protein